MFGKKIPKKAMAVAVGVILSAAGSMSVFANYIHEAGYSDDPCQNCGDTSVWVTEEICPASPTGGERPCPDHRFGTDAEMRNHTALSYLCHECYYGWSEDEYSYFWECHGYDLPGFD